MDQFEHGYRPGTAIFYIALTGRDGEEMAVSSAMVEQWSDEWIIINKDFEERLKGDADLEHLSRKMFFFTYDGNHRYEAWREFLEEGKVGDLEFMRRNGEPESIILDVGPKGFPKILAAMHAVNK